MAKGKNNNYVSVWFWMFALFVMALPCVGFIMVIVWAFAGENESRKNYFRAIIAWFLILSALWMAIFTFGFWPLVEKQFQALWQPNQVTQPVRKQPPAAPRNAPSQIHPPVNAPQSKHNAIQSPDHRTPPS